VFLETLPSTTGTGRTINTAVMGVAAWSFADALNPVGRRLSEAEAEAVMKKSGVASTRQMLYGSSRR
jgi:hypothetical protein